MTGTQSPQRFGDYELIERLGSGGFGTVWKAREVSLGRIVALKVLNADLADDPDWIRRFHREARIAASLDHPAIPPIYRFGDVDGAGLAEADKNGFTLQWSTNLVQWFDLTNATRSVVGGKVELEDTDAAGKARKFYRVIER